MNSRSNPANPITNDLFDEEINDIEEYGEDPKRPYPIISLQVLVVVLPVDFSLAEDINNLLRNSTDPIRESLDMGIDIYLAINIYHLS